MECTLQSRDSSCIDAPIAVRDSSKNQRPRVSINQCVQTVLPIPKKRRNGNMEQMHSCGCKVQIMIDDCQKLNPQVTGADLVMCPVHEKAKEMVLLLKFLYEKPQMLGFDGIKKVCKKMIDEIEKEKNANEPTK
jgi:hypothetical protein